MLLRCYPRIHVGLMDLGNASFRRYGGGGFTLSDLPIEITAYKSKKLTVEGIELLDEVGQLDVLSTLERLKVIVPSAKGRITIRQIPSQHVGLGTKTALLLGILVAVCRSNGISIPRATLQRLSGRGGASGIGINSFFSGGFVADAGHTAQTSSDFKPSSAGEPTNIPPPICRIPIPQQWRFYLILPQGQRISGMQERAFFRSTTPIPKHEVLRSLALLYHGIIPAIYLQDLELLGRSLRDLHKIGFKRRELEYQSDTVKSVIDSLGRPLESAVGLSSMGPLIYVIAHQRDTRVELEVKKVCIEREASLLSVCRGRNRGYEIVQ